MLSARVIPCLLLKDGGLVKTVKFDRPKYIGDPINAVKIFNEKEVDELIFLDIEASRSRSGPKFDVLRELVTECFMPFSYGGGIHDVEQIKNVLRIGVEKVIINNRALQDIGFIKQAVGRFGSSTIIGAIDINVDIWGRTRLFDHVNRENLKKDVTTHINDLCDAGVGEIFLNFVNRDGTYSGYDTLRIKSLISDVNVPVIVCGGASEMEDIAMIVRETGVSGAAAGSLFVYQGPHRAVLISYPRQEELRLLFNNRQHE